MQHCSRDINNKGGRSDITSHALFPLGCFIFSQTVGPEPGTNTQHTVLTFCDTQERGGGGISGRTTSIQHFPSEMMQQHGTVTTQCLKNQGRK
jgi:hypothetical protein